MKRQKRKDVWHFARLVRKEECWEISRRDLTNEHSETAYCLLCNFTTKFRVGKCKMPQHIMKEHPDELAAYVAQTAQRERGEGEPVIRNLDSAFSAVEDPRKKRKLRVISAKEQKRVNELLAEWAARHFRPLVIVEDAGFVAFIQFITEDLGGVSLTLPKRAKLREEIIVLAAEYRRRVRKDIVTGCEYFSITVDIWTSRNAKSYISLTIHYVDQTFTPKNWTLEVLEFPGIHTGSTIAAAITRILADWSLLKRWCVMLLRDSGSNTVSAGNKLGIKHMACIAHSLHLVVGGALVKKSKTRGGVDKPAWADEVAAESVEDIAEREEEEGLSREARGSIEVLQELAIDEMEEFLDDAIAGLRHNDMSALRKIVQHFRTLAVYFRKSPKGNNRLGKIQVEHCNVKPDQVLRPMVDCPTRWNSCWEMLQRLITLQGALAKFFAYLKKPEGRTEFDDMTKKLRRPKPEEWFAIKCLKVLLGPFAVASETLSGQTYPTAPLVLPALSGIRKHLEREDLFNALAAEEDDDENYVFETKRMMNECREAMLALYTKRFKELELKWVAFLDPRVAKRMSHLSPADTPGACKEVVKAMVDLARDSLPSEDPENASPAPVQAEQQVRDYMYDHMFGPDIVPARPTKLGRRLRE